MPSPPTSLRQARRQQLRQGEQGDAQKGFAAFRTLHVGECFHLEICNVDRISL
jgi:hypothetical protein